MDDLATRAGIIMARADELAAISETADGFTTRTFGSEAMRQANALVGEWLWQAKLDTRTDAIGNLRAFPPRDGRPLLLLGSHLDTVREAGRYDGPLGVLVAISCAEAAARGDHGVLPCRLGVVGFSDEEGTRFGTSYLGSDVLAGSPFDPERLALADAHGITLGHAIRAVGGDVAASRPKPSTRTRKAAWSATWRSTSNKAPSWKPPTCPSAWSAPSRARADSRSASMARPVTPGRHPWPCAATPWPGRRSSSTPLRPTRAKTMASSPRSASLKSVPARATSSRQRGGFARRAQPPRRPAPRCLRRPPGCRHRHRRPARPRAGLARGPNPRRHTLRR